VSFVLWELSHDNPIVDVRMFRRAGFAISNVLMLTLGIALFGSTVLLPQYLQILMGYTAEQSGMALSPGGLLVIALLPVVGILVSRADARFLVAFGFLVMSGSLFYMAHKLDLQMNFGEAVELRCIQSVGLAFLFVPIQTLSYSGIPPQKNNQVSGIMNLSRNMGGDIGIAFVTTFIARRSQSHQAVLSAHTTAYDSQFQAALAALTNAMQHAGSSSVEAARRAMAALYRQLFVQATQLAYLDTLWVIGIATAAMAPLVFLAKKPQGRAPAGAH
jgi:DHA2 family multidrug resistance protein